MNDEDLELSVLDICSQGGYIAPIGAWKDTVERLHAQGLLEKLDAMNYIITPAGSAEFEKRENAEVMGVFREQQALARPVIEGEVIPPVPPSNIQQQLSEVTRRAFPRQEPFIEGEAEDVTE